MCIRDSLTANIKLLHDHPRPYHFSNECDMLNRIVLGLTAKQFRLANGIEKGKSIRPYLSDSQIMMLDTLQTVSYTHLDVYKRQSAYRAKRYAPFFLFINQESSS